VQPPMLALFVRFATCTLVAIQPGGFHKTFQRAQQLSIGAVCLRTRHEPSVWMLFAVGLEPFQKVGRNGNVPLLLVLDLEAELRL